MVYLKSIGVNESYGNSAVYQKAIDCRRDKSITAYSLFNHLSFPVHWSYGISLDQCIDTPMHQIFQGIVKSIMETAMSWLTHKDNAQYKAFGDFVNVSMFHIQQLNLDWCRIEKFMKGRSYTLGGWQAEQFIAFTRVIIVICGAVCDVVGDSEVGIDEFECMIQTLLCLTSCLISNVHIDRNTFLAYIKLFLSACDLFENKVYIMHNNDAMWYSKGNFLSLLNLPSQVLKFGNLRYYWEGSRERSIQQIKPYLINIRLTSPFSKQN